MAIKYKQIGVYGEWTLSNDGDYVLNIYDDKEGEYIEIEAREGTLLPVVMKEENGIEHFYLKELMVFYFHPKYKNKNLGSNKVIHKDGNKKNFNINNLEVVSLEKWNEIEKENILRNERIKKIKERQEMINNLGSTYTNMMLFLNNGKKKRS